MAVASRTVDGIVVVDKPSGRTSHDVVAMLRRRFGQKRVGHAGTLDPMATGVLIGLLGEGTKLSDALSGQRKRYRAEIALGSTTDTLDADGTVTERAPLPQGLAEALEAGDATVLADALKAERDRHEQTPPRHAAIKIDGRKAYELARRGREVEMPPRPVQVFALEVEAMQPDAITVTLEVSKGYYVRALARDLGVGLGVPAHLTALRRTQSGSFAEDEAVELASASDAELRASVVPVALAARRALPIASLTVDGALRAKQGKVLDVADFTTIDADSGDGACAWLDPDGRLVALGEPVPDEPSRWRVRRGFNP